VDRASVGEAVHAALAELYSGGIWRRERFADPASRRRAVEGAIERAFDATLTDLARGAPALEASLRRRWTEAVADFVENDVAALTSFGARAADVELPFRVDLELDGAAFTLRGRIDRICEGAEGRRVVADYKTGARDVDEYLKPRSLDKGRTLQLPLYALAVESLRAGLPDIEAIRIHPDLDTRGRKNVKRLDASELADARAGLARAVSTLVALARAGRFPLTPKPDEDCAFCAYRIACRRLHAPTRERQLTAEAYAAFYRLREGTGAEEPGGEESSS
jgi:hypothetical protein